MPITSSDAWSLARLDAHGQAALVAGGDLPPAELVEAAIPRIEEGDRALNAAGLVPVGLSAMPDLGLLVSGEPLLGGPTLNPWDGKVGAGGSSTGAAVAVAAGAAVPA